MNSRQLCIMLIRLISLLCFMLSLVSVPIIFASNEGGTVLDLSLIYIRVLLFALILPTILWFLAPFLSKYMELSEDETLVINISASMLFKLGVALIGLWLALHAILQLVGLGLLLLDSSLGSLNRNLYESVLSGILKLVIGAFLFSRSATVLGLGIKLGILDKES